MELNQWVGNKIKQFRLEKKLTQTQLADLIDTTKQTISRYEKGDRKANQDVLFALSDLFEKTIDDFFPPISKKNTPSAPQVELIPSTLQKINATSSKLEHERQLIVLDTAETQLQQQNTVEDSKNTVTDNIIPFPKLSSYNYYDQPASAGTGQYLNDVQVETIELPVDYDADFVIPIYGDSMEPEYHSGDYVFVKLSVNLSDGDIGVFEYYGDAYIKQLLINDEGAFLHSLNVKYDDIQIDADSDFRIIGEIIGSFTPIEM
ncbi:phage transcriptional repressor [Streptococcus varani]|uniref:Phage transcriptional repressor n=1 Tax=Streptococcus varani TaxID=1608583 RepID=A0A0E3WF01_9STRE|nr:helix-turn-helix transcriptional regulator [Streptococcus varani]CQR24618.1 phage transcriptional repressor [Streptococcus varani]